MGRRHQPDPKNEQKHTMMWTLRNDWWFVGRLIGLLVVCVGGLIGRLLFA